tara:strand:+ start:445 stop:741 length:297 start_codon:yes stop_codon:yes gene_type:complete
MNKLAIIPIFFLSMCGTAPITDPPAHANILPRDRIRGEIDITSLEHIQTLQMMFIKNLRKDQIEENMTRPIDAINNALDDFWEDQNGSNGSTEQKKLL